MKIFILALILIANSFASFVIQNQSGEELYYLTGEGIFDKWGGQKGIVDKENNRFCVYMIDGEPFGEIIGNSIYDSNNLKVGEIHQSTYETIWHVTTYAHQSSFLAIIATQVWAIGYDLSLYLH